MEKIKISKINITNFLGVKDAEITPGAITLISGENGTGKTSILEGIKAVFGAGKAATLINNESDEAEVGLLFDNGVEATRRITKSKNELVVTENGKEVKAPVDFLKKMLALNTINPIDILTMKPKDRKDLILANIEVPYPGVQIDGIIKEVNLNTEITHTDALTDINNLYTRIFSERTVTNRLLKDKKGAVEELKKTLPAGQNNEPITDTKNRYGIIVGNIEKITGSLQEYLGKIKDQKGQELVAFEQKYSADKAAIEAKYGGAENNAKEKCNAQLTELRAAENQCKVALENSARIEQTQATIGTYSAEATQLETTSNKYTTNLAKLEGLKTMCLQQLPFPGLEFRDDDIYVNGIAFDTLNTAQRIQMAVKIALLNNPPFMVIDGAEALDDNTFNMLAAELKGANTQFIATKVTNTQLTVQTA